MTRLPHIALLVAICLSAMSFVVRVDSIPELLAGESLYIRSELDDRTIDSTLISGPAARLGGEMERTEWCRICYTYPVNGGVATRWLPLFIGGNDSVSVVFGDYAKGELRISGSALNDAYAGLNAYMKSLMPMDHDRMAHFLAYATAMARDNKSNPLGAYLASFLSSAMDEEEWIVLHDSLSPDLRTYRPLAKAYAKANGLRQSRPGCMFTDIKGLNADGSAASLSDFIGKGRYVLVDFWASWCGPCRMEAKETLMPLYEKYKDDDRLTILGVMTSDSPESHLRGLKNIDYPWPQFIDADNAAGGIYGFNSIPMIMLFAPDGTIVARDIRGRDVWQAVESAISQ